MSEIKPNHVCKNINCHKGADGGRKHYYACNLCDKRNNWRSVACSLECYEEYQKQVLEARSKGKHANILPERTDMTAKEIEANIINAPEDIVAKATLEELSDFGESIDEIGLPSTIDEINTMLDKKQKVNKNVNSKVKKTNR